jgi:HSP20 family molecular chaperone IbpA
VQEGKAEATYKNGVLSLKLPKSERCKKKAVKIAIH